MLLWTWGQFLVETHLRTRQSIGELAKAHGVHRAAALTRLENVGNGTGRAWAAGCAATAIPATLEAN